mgnify:CR=1 FL=1|tara:strand:- start:2175 stop:2399 length:225 start_codon:yes stop_codon:yes gene_type:complete
MKYLNNLGTYKRWILTSLLTFTIMVLLLGLVDYYKITSLNSFGVGYICCFIVSPILEFGWYRDKDAQTMEEINE